MNMYVAFHIKKSSIHEHSQYSVRTKLLEDSHPGCSFGFLKPILLRASNIRN